MVEGFEVVGPYRHWKLRIEAPLAWVVMDVDPHGGVRASYTLKLNSYDLGVDIELADIVQRLRFEHPEVRVVILTSALDRVFCAGANITMLSQASHAAKVNFCKFTNETRCAIEDATDHSGQIYIAACNGTTAGGGYELALACREIYLPDDGQSAVALPEVSLLGVLPGTGGLTRLLEKRHVRRDHADLFCTTPAGVRGRRAVDWRLIDGLFPRSSFLEDVKARALIVAREDAPPRTLIVGPEDAPSQSQTSSQSQAPSQSQVPPQSQAPPQPEARPSASRHAPPRRQAPPDASRPVLRLSPLAPAVQHNERCYRHVTLRWDDARRLATLVVQGPTAADVESLPVALDHAAAEDLWALRCFRELDDALLHLRVDHRKTGLVVVRAIGDPELVLAHDVALYERRGSPRAREILLNMARVVRRMDNTTRSFFALADTGTAFVGCLLELALASDRVYLLDDPEARVAMGVSPLNHGILPTFNRWSRLQGRLQGREDRLAELEACCRLLTPSESEATGLSTSNLDALDWDDEVRLAMEERLSLSPDALVGMEQNLRFPGPESMESKIFARLSAWQNWVFGRPNATGPKGALTLYGQPERPQFNWDRV